mgnify:CR=1 FL=1
MVGDGRSVQNGGWLIVLRPWIIKEIDRLLSMQRNMWLEGHALGALLCCSCA